MQSIEPLQPRYMGAERPLWSESLLDNTRVRIRPICEEDAAAELAFIEALSPRARRNRFLGQMKHPSAEMIEHFTSLDYEHEMAFAATLENEEKVEFIAVCRYSTSLDGTACECAVTVLDRWQNKGLGTVMMKHLIDVAESSGITQMWSMDSASNVEMRELAHDLGFERKSDPDNPSQVIHTLWLGRGRQG